MTNEKQQSAVEWLISQQKHNQFFDIETIEQAKAMFQEQIENAYWDGGQDVPMSGKQCIQYYNEIYNNK